MRERRALVAPTVVTASLDADGRAVRVAFPCTQVGQHISRRPWSSVTQAVLLRVQCCDILGELVHEVRVRRAEAPADAGGQVEAY